MRFKLVRYFLLTSLLAFVLVTAGLAYFYRISAVNNLLSLQESKNVALTQVFANSLWDEFRDFVQRSAGKSGDELRADPQMQRIRASTLDLVGGLSVVKVKVFNLDGLTVFSTEAAQIGDDKTGNAGYQSAVKGIPASELTHRDTFSAFEGEKENLDVISSYIPIVNPDTKKMEGVFEVYDEVTPFLKQIERTQIVVVAGVVTGLLTLFIVLFFIIKRADGIIRKNTSERMEVESQLAQSEKMASLGQMVAGIAHELNTPLGFTKSNIDLVDEMIGEFGVLADATENVRHFLDSKRSVDPTISSLAEQFDDVPGKEDISQIREMLSFCAEGVEQMSDLVTNLKDFARLDRARVATVDINKSVDSVLRIARNVIKDGININRMYGEIPDIECMPSQINQVLLNLITNSAQAMNGCGSIWIRTERCGNQVEILVQDNGPGIPEAQLVNIFKPFYTTKEVGEGTGLGLSISKKIIEQHSGKITVKSLVGRGTRFTILLPITQSGPQLMSEAA